jgi:hypothetical protein
MSIENDPGERLRQLANAAVDSSRMPFLPNRYPTTYACDFLRNHWEVVPAHIAQMIDGDPSRPQGSRSAASYVRQAWAAELGIDDDVVARIFADAHLREHGIDVPTHNDGDSSGD